MTVRIDNGVALATFGEALIKNGGRIELLGGTLDTQFVNIEGGVLAGEGEVFAGTGPFHSPVRNLGGRIEPGDPIGLLTIDGDLSQQTGGTLAFDLAGTTAISQYDRLAVDRFAFLSGTLEVNLLAFTPSVGAAFTILTTGEGLFGEFDTLVLPGGFQWDVAYGANNVVLTVLSLGLAGDYNQNGVVDAADFVVWRNTMGATGSGLAADGNGDQVVNQGDFDVWKRQFGKTSGAGSALTTNVPEPATAGLLLLCVGLLSMCRPLNR